MDCGSTRKQPCIIWTPSKRAQDMWINNNNYAQVLLQVYLSLVPKIQLPEDMGNTSVGLAKEVSASCQAVKRVTEPATSRTWHVRPLATRHVSFAELLPAKDAWPAVHVWSCVLEVETIYNCSPERDGKKCGRRPVENDVHDSKISISQWQLPVGTCTMSKHEAVAWTVHGLQTKLCLLDFKAEHILLTAMGMAGQQSSVDTEKQLSTFTHLFQRPCIRLKILVLCITKI
eukprot:365912-Chlamydomonas_euryale.AAC.4